MRSGELFNDCQSNIASTCVTDCDVSNQIDILLVTHRVPFPPDKGDRIRTFHLLRFLADHGRVHLASLSDEPLKARTASALATLCHRVVIVPIGRFHRLRGLRSLAFGGTISAGVFRSRRLKEIIQSWAAETSFHSAVASASSVAHYLEIPNLARARRVVDLVDVDSQKWRDYAAVSRMPMSWIYGMESRRLRRLERSICNWASAVTLVSERESQLLRENASTPNIYTVTNGVDLEYYEPAAGGSESGCVFVGALDYMPNVEGICWFARSVWPNVRQWRPEARLAIVGRKPVAAVQDLKAIPGVDVIGQVPDVRPYLASSAVVIAPLRIARGLQNKVLEAMAAGKPVVASPAALAGFGDRPDLPAWAASDAAEWVAILTNLLVDPAKRRQLGEAGRVFAETYHNWNSCLEPFSDLLGLRPALADGAAS
jgi:sugar transferase (PEP-CTERM/EpsH1 system associated)